MVKVTLRNLEVMFLNINYVAAYEELIPTLLEIEELPASALLVVVEE